MEVWNPEHPHHAVWREYTQSLLDGEPKTLHVRLPNDGRWIATDMPGWSPEHEYRIARPMLQLTYSVPMPVTKPLGIGQSYWLVTLRDAHQTTWHSDSIDQQRLRAGLIYLTEADAQAAIDARNAAMTDALEAAK